MPWRAFKGSGTAMSAKALQQRASQSPAVQLDVNGAAARQHLDKAGFYLGCHRRPVAPERASTWGRLRCKSAASSAWLSRLWASCRQRHGASPAYRAALLTRSGSSTPGLLTYCRCCRSRNKKTLLANSIRGWNCEQWTDSFCNIAAAEFSPCRASPPASNRFRNRQPELRRPCSLRATPISRCLTS